MIVTNKYGEQTSAKKKATSRSKTKIPKDVAIPKTSDGIEVKEIEAIPAQDFQSHAKKLVSGNYAAILAMMAEKSAAGSLAHTKYLFEIGGVKEDIERQGQDSEPTLADLLLAEIRRQRSGDETAAAEQPDTTNFFDADGTLGEHTPAGAEERGQDCGAKAQ